MHPKHKKRAPKWAHILLTKGATAPVVGIKPQKKTRAKGTRVTTGASHHHTNKSTKKSQRGLYIANPRQRSNSSSRGYKATKE